MSLCPKCHRECEPGLNQCPDCGTSLASSLQEPSTDSADETALVELAVFPNVSEAEMVQELLESNDIETSLRGETDPIGATSGAEPVTLLVERGKFPAAKEIYDAYFAGEPSGIEEGMTEQD